MHKQRPVHYPWDWVSSQLLNRKCEEIFNPFQDDKNWTWARRLEWAINSHLVLGEEDMDKLQEDCVRVLQTSREGVNRSELRYYFKSLSP